MKRRYFLNTSLAAAVAAALPTRQAMAAVLAALSTVEGDVRALTPDGAEVTLERAALQELSDQLRGRLLLPGSEGYEKARRVLNLSIDKPAVFREIARVLKPGGRVSVSDLVLVGELPSAVKESALEYVGCVAGALPLGEYVGLLLGAGLRGVTVERIVPGERNEVVSATFTAVKP